MSALLIVFALFVDGVTVCLSADLIKALQELSKNLGAMHEITDLMLDLVEITPPATHSCLAPTASSLEASLTEVLIGPAPGHVPNATPSSFLRLSLVDDT